MKSIWKFSILFLFFWNLSIWSESLKELNKQGLRSLNRGNYQESIAYFRKALRLDPKNSFAHYNLACAMSALLEKEYCSYIDDIPKIYNHIQSAVKANSTYKIKMLKDPDFASLQKEYKFYQIAGFNSKNPNHIRMILTNVHWYGPSPGVFGPKNGILFGKDGTFQYWVAEFDSDGNIMKKYYKGLYKIQKSNILFEFQDLVPNLKKTKFQGSLRGAKLSIPGFPNPFSDDDSACSA